MGWTRFALLGLLLSVCSTHRREGATAHIRLTAERRVSALPATVRFHAFIEGGRDDEPLLYCPDVVWNFQAAQFRDERDCEPYAPGARIQRAYVADHTFEREGVYDVEVRLLQRGRSVLSATVEIMVRRNAVTIRRP